MLEAYQTSLEEKDVTIESYKNELARFSSRSREIAAENENLYHQLEEANEKVLIQFWCFLVKIYLVYTVLFMYFTCILSSPSPNYMAYFIII